MKKILARRVDNLGDIVIALPVFNALRKHFANCHLTVMVKPQHRSLLKDIADAFIEPMTVEKTILLPGYSHIINIEYSYPAGYKPQKSKQLRRVIHIGTPDWSKAQHISLHLKDGLKAHGINCRNIKPKFTPSDNAKEHAKNWFNVNGLKNEMLLISIDPNSGFSKKCWHVNGFLRVCRYLVDKYQCKIIIPSAESPDMRAQYLVDNLPTGAAHLLTGMQPDAVAAVIKKCDLHIGNDSGIGHLAAAVSVPAVSIFGPTDPFLWKPSGSKNLVIYKKEINCPGGYEHAKKCMLQKCLLNIQPQDVIDGVLYSLTKFIERDKLHSAVKLNVSNDLVIQKTWKGYILQNKKTGHQCLIAHGWKNVKSILKEINDAGTFKIAKNHLPLVDMLIMHRVVEPSKP
jgi:ADP-heptose:LPS heptosyltransferase